MAVAVALVVGASLLIRSFLALGVVDPGFETDRLLVLETSARARPAGAAAATAFYEQRCPDSPRAGRDRSRRSRSSRGPALRHESNGGYWPKAGRIRDRRRASAAGDVHGRHAGLSRRWRSRRRGRDFSARDAPRHRW
jgi:hypothetical protein